MNQNEAMSQLYTARKIFETSASEYLNAVRATCPYGSLVKVKRADQSRPVSLVVSGYGADHGDYPGCFMGRSLITGAIECHAVAKSRGWPLEAPRSLSDSIEVVESDTKQSHRALPENYMVFYEEARAAYAIAWEDFVTAVRRAFPVGATAEIVSDRGLIEVEVVGYPEVEIDYPGYVFGRSPANGSVHAFHPRDLCARPQLEPMGDSKEPAPEQLGPW